MFRFICAAFSKSIPWILSKVESATQSPPPTPNLVSPYSYLSGGNLIEKVNGTWQNSGISFTNASVSADGLTVVAITGTNQICVRNRSSMEVSFNSATPVYLNMPVSSTDGTYSPNLSRITVSADGKRIVATAMKAVPGNQYISTALWNGSSWVLSTFSQSNPNNYGQDLHVSISPGGDRLIQVRSDGSVFSYKYSGFPSIPWENVGNIGPLSTINLSGVWRSETSWASMEGTTLKIYTRPGTSSQISLSASFTKEGLGVPSASVLKLLSYSNGKYLMMMDLYTLAEFSPTLESKWRLDAVASGNVPIIGASPDGRSALLFNETSGTNYPNSTMLLER